MGEGGCKQDAPEIEATQILAPMVSKRGAGTFFRSPKHSTPSRTF